MLSIEDKPYGIVFKVFVQPRSSKNSLAGLHGDALKIRLTAPPVDNAANKMCLKYLAKCLGVSGARLEIVSGHTGRSKRVLFCHVTGQPSGNDLEALRRQVERLISDE